MTHPLFNKHYQVRYYKPGSTLGTISRELPNEKEAIAWCLYLTKEPGWCTFAQVIDTDKHNAIVFERQTLTRRDRPC